MNNKIFTLFISCLVSACSITTGIITDAEGFFIVGKIEKSYELAAFTSAKSNMPIGVVTEENEFYFLAVNAADYDVLIYEKVKIKGHLDKKNRVILPTQILYLDESTNQWNIFL